MTATNITESSGTIEPGVVTDNNASKQYGQIRIVQAAAVSPEYTTPPGRMILTEASPVITQNLFSSENAPPMAVDLTEDEDNRSKRINVEHEDL